MPPNERHITINGLSVPTFLYGTAWKEKSTQCCVKKAMEAGFRGIDTANQRKHYHEAAVGSALREVYDGGGLTRKDLFLQTKFTHLAGQDERLPYDANADLHTQVMQSYASSLQHLNTDYLDSFVLHGPSRRRGLAQEDWEAWRAMEDCSLKCFRLPEPPVPFICARTWRLTRLTWRLTTCSLWSLLVKGKSLNAWRVGWERP